MIPVLLAFAAAAAAAYAYSRYRAGQAAPAVYVAPVPGSVVAPPLWAVAPRQVTELAGYGVSVADTYGNPTGSPVPSVPAGTQVIGMSWQ